MASSTTVGRPVERSPRDDGQYEINEKGRELVRQSSPPREPATMSIKENAEVFKADLDSVRSLVTCTICDQLLYEPWTLACGHTYCYSCLCSWFLPHKRKKSCPDCRSPVKRLPAPAFLIKQMVDLFVNRAELLPADETIEQHRQRQKDENGIVEADKESEIGLFKGCFGHQDAVGTLVFNEEDRLYRCAGCGHEYQGGDTCDNCNLVFDPEEAGMIADAFDRHSMDSMDSLEMFDIEHGLGDYGSEVDYSDEDDDNDNPFFISIGGVRQGNDGLVGPGGFWPHPDTGFARVPHPLSQVHNARDDGWGSPLGSSQISSDGEDEDDEDGGSLQDFVVPDEHHGHGHTDESHASNNSESASDSEEDDGGPIRGVIANSRRQARRAWDAARRPFAGDSTDGSEDGDLQTALEVDRTRVFDRSRWSPLDNGAESENGEREPMVRMVRMEQQLITRAAGEQSSEESNSDSDSDTDTIGNHRSDDDDDDDDEDDDDEDDGEEEEIHQGHNATSGHFHFGAERAVLRNRNRNGGPPDWGHGFVPYSDDIRGSSIDGEGDVEMSTSPPDSSNVSVTTDNTHQDRQPSIEYLGTVNSVHDVAEEDESDVSPQPPSRRRPQPVPGQRQVLREPRPAEDDDPPRERRVYRERPLINHGYDPRISSLFARHQSNLRNLTQQQSPYFDGPVSDRALEASSLAAAFRDHRPPQTRPPRRTTVSQYHSLRPQIPSIIDRSNGPVIMPSSSTRPNRVQRQYTRR